MIDGTTKLKKLEGLYQIHERCVTETESACTMGCATCCTRNVTLTSLEGAFLLSRLDEREKKEAMDRILARRDRPRLIPLATVNAMARLCAEGRDLPEEACDPAWAPCPLLDSDMACTVYEHRPFACRAMVSQSACGTYGEADMDDYLFTLNNVFMQVIEHMDQGGAFANLIDMLIHLSDGDTLDHYLKQGFLSNPPPSFLINQPIGILMVPPEHRDSIQPLILAINENL